MKTYAAGAALLLMLAVVSACGHDNTEKSDPQQPDTALNPSRSASDAATGSTDPRKPTTVSPRTNLLNWNPVESSADRVIVGPEGTLEVNKARTEARLVGAHGVVPVPAGRNRTITDMFLEGDQAWIVTQDEFEQRPNELLVVDSVSGASKVALSPRPGSGGPWAHAPGIIAYASWSPGKPYCLAVYDIAFERGETGYCATPGHGFTNLEWSGEGLAMMSFDNARPVSCRTLTIDPMAIEIEPSLKLRPITGVPKCQGFDALAITGGAIWSVLPHEDNVETAEFFASAKGRYFALGTGSTGTLTWCGGSAYFAQDSTGENGRARLMRWTPDSTLEVVYESPGTGEAFLEKPSCAEADTNSTPNGVITVTAYGQGGDERVSAVTPR